MKTTTTTRDYDDEGRMVRETITEQETPDTRAACSCIVGTWSYWCPLHGGYMRSPVTWTSQTITPSAGATYTVNVQSTVNQREVAKLVAQGQRLRDRRS